MDASLLFLNANTPWVYALAERMASHCPVHAVRMYDWLVYWRNRPSWPDDAPVAGLTRSFKVLPPGYAGRLEWLARPFMRWAVTRWQKALRARSGGAEPWAVVPYPYLAPWTKRIPDERLIYYNLDDYELYRPERAASVRRKERSLIQRAALTVCLSRYQVEAFRERYPERAERIVHFPLGTTKDFLNPAPKQPPDRPRTVGYVGNLTDRVDWSFVRSVAQRCRDVEFIFVGSLEDLQTGGSASGWKSTRRAAFAEPNVRHVGPVAQRDVPKRYHAFGMNWIPYDPEHPFNRASCPTKVMDAIASGRPVVSTAVPECRLYPEWIRVVETPAEAAEAVRRGLEDDEPSHDSVAQVAFARQHTWRQRAQTLLHHLRRV